MTRSRWQLLLAIVAALSITARALGQTIRVVAITGQPLPGAEGEGYRGNLRLPVIDAQGRVSFSTTVGGEAF